LSKPTHGAVTKKTSVHSRTVTTAPAPTKARDVHIVESFHPKLLTEQIVQRHWTLARPAALTLGVDGVSHGHTRGQTSGRFPIPPSFVGKPHPRPKGPGTAKVNFEFGEANFKAYDRLQFRLRARSRNGGADASQAVILSRTTGP
jgi:hypothetical protein